MNLFVPNDSGLPGVTYDLETQQLRLPISFAVDLATLQLPLDFGSPRVTALNCTRMHWPR